MEAAAKNKVIVVTGGADGLGYAIADSFLKGDAQKIIIVDINEAKGTEAADKLNTKYGQGKANFIKCDVNKDLQRVSTDIFNRYKTVDVLVNSAGILDENNPRKVIEINVIALIEWSLKFLEHMRKDKGGNGGTIINMGSIYSYTVDPYLAVYKAAKYAVMGFSRTLGHEQNYKIYGVKVLVLCPGLTNTNMTDKLTCWPEQSDAFMEFAATEAWQVPENVGTAAVKLFETVDSGTAWSVVGGDITQVPST